MTSPPLGKELRILLTSNRKESSQQASYTAPVDSTARQHFAPPPVPRFKTGDPMFDEPMSIVRQGSSAVSSLS